MRQLTKKTDPLGRVTLAEWCTCGAMKSLTDPMGRTTSWSTDVQGRRIAKQYGDGSQVNYVYENTSSRLRQVIDEKQQSTLYSYNLDNSIQSVAFGNTANAAIFGNTAITTPNVSYTYDPNYKRVTSMTDGLGTTTYGYYQAGSLGGLHPAAMNGPWANEIVTYAYDELGRMTNRSIDGIAESWSRDILGRVTNSINALGSFGYAYDGASRRLTDVAYPAGQTSHFDYFGNTGDDRLQQMTHRQSNTSLISQFTYAYDVIGNTTTWAQTQGSFNETWTAGYDAADRLSSVLDNQGGTNTVSTSYAYDAADNRQVEDVNGVSTNSQFNTLNELVSKPGASPANATYEWDGLHRLTAVARGTNRSEFTYDGGGHLRIVIEKSGGATVSERQFVWCGNRICEERDANNSVVSRFFSAGEQRGGTNFHYFTDRLGSIRELTDNASVIRAEYAYSPFGAKERLQGDLESTFGFTRLLNHEPSATLFAVHRVYDPGSARWLSRDPIGEIGGLNLFGYASQNPLRWTDPLGYDNQDDFDDIGKFVTDGEFSVDALFLYNGLKDFELFDKIVGGHLAVIGSLISIGIAWNDPTDENIASAEQSCALTLMTLFPPTSLAATVISGIMILNDNTVLFDSLDVPGIPKYDINEDWLFKPLPGTPGYRGPPPASTPAPYDYLQGGDAPY